MLWANPVEEVVDHRAAAEETFLLTDEVLADSDGIAQRWAYVADIRFAEVRGLHVVGQQRGE
ncbi:hypothetical protein [Streptomyces luteogriseus]|uniref:hypothetical protein n=1 Tax=Streptomyces luteogriseus TaxID=68233 RepID=UPI00371AEF16